VNYLSNQISNKIKSKIFEILAMVYNGSFHFWVSLSLRPKTETKQLNFVFSPVSRLTNHCGASSMTSSGTHGGFRHIF